MSQNSVGIHGIRVREKRNKRSAFDGVKSNINPYINVLLHRARKEVKSFLSTSFCLLAHQSNPRFGGGFPFSYETGVNFLEIRSQWSVGE